MSDLGVNFSEIQEEVSEDTSMANLQVSVSELSPCCPEKWPFPIGNTTARWCEWPEHRALKCGILVPRCGFPVTWQNSAGCLSQLGVYLSLICVLQGLLQFSRTALQSCSQGVDKAPTAVDFQSYLYKSTKCLPTSLGTFWQGQLRHD